MKGKKGISPIIATILLLLIVIAIVGFTFGFFQTIFQTSSQAGTQQIQDTTNLLQKSVRIDAVGSAGSRTVTIRHVGTSTIQPNELTVLVNGVVVSCTWNPAMPLAAGGVSTCTWPNTEAACSGSGATTVRVSAPAGPVEATC